MAVHKMPNKKKLDKQSGQTGSLCYRLGELAERLGGRLEGDPNLLIRGVSDLAGACEGDISFLTDEKYARQVPASLASAILMAPGLPMDRPAILVDRPDRVLVKLLELFSPPLPHPIAGIHPSAVVETTIPASVGVGANSYIGAGTAIGENTVIYPNVYIAADVTIGSDCVIWPGVVIRERTRIGNRVTLHPNATIGADGFGYNFVDGRHQKIPHIGTVIIEDDVEIGAGTCVDRAKIGATVIGTGTKVDNLVQIAHNVKVGRHVILAGQVGISGSAAIGDYAVLAGSAGLHDHVTVGEGARLGARAIATKDIPPNMSAKGDPAIDIHEYQRQQVRIRRLGQMFETMTTLAKRVDDLEQTIHDIEGKRT